MIGLLARVIPAPYRALAAVLAVVVAVGAVYVKGRVDGARSEAKDTAQAIAKATRRANAAGEALHAAAGRLRADAAAFRTIARTLDDNIARAERARAAAEAQAQHAGRDAQRLQRTLSALEARLGSDRAHCDDGSTPICGTPLR